MKHGPLMLLQLGEVPTIIASSPRVAKEILKDNGEIFSDRAEWFAGNIMGYGGIGILLSPYGGHWRQLRKICNLGLFSAKKVQSFMSVREEEVAKLVESVLSMAGQPVNLSKMIFSSVNDITCRAIFGEKCKENKIFLALVKEFVEVSATFQIADLFPSYKFLHGISGVKHRLEKIHQEIDKILEEIINEHRQNRAVKMQEDLLDVLLRLQNDNKLEFPLENNCIKALILVSISSKP
ncbi:Cytochrome p450 [Thalictrum thalictroides]|uniref:Cytochrome p450 n=1 Tax=Thalictrum thalictroides TaxID=46969 RepID=A0A7J6WW68_THATH|nr:Cytochrome p450 [Thalictrum thalictroides]